MPPPVRGHIPTKDNHAGKGEKDPQPVAKQEQSETRQAPLKYGGQNETDTACLMCVYAGNAIERTCSTGSLG